MNNSKNFNEDIVSLISSVRVLLEYYQELGLNDLNKSILFSKPSLNYFATSIFQKLGNIQPSMSTNDMAKKNTSSPDQLSLFETDNSSTKTELFDKQLFKINRSLGKLSLEELRSATGNCCNLCKQATNIVFGEGHPKAELMFIGEAPGADEDATGRPFVGAAGRLLDKIIAAIGLKREEVYITNVVKCRPPNNRKPTNDEMTACEPFLFNEIELINPKLIVTLGATPLVSLLNVKEGITKTRGQFYNFQGIPVMPTFHPAFLLRVPERKREVWEDMKKVMGKLQEIKNSIQ